MPVTMWSSSPEGKGVENVSPVPEHSLPPLRPRSPAAKTDAAGNMPGGI